MPIDYKRATTVRESKGVILVPKGFLTKSPPVFYTVERVEDRAGNTLSVGISPEKGEWGFQGRPVKGGPGPDADPSNPKEGRHYFRFGVTP